MIQRRIYNPLKRLLNRFRHWQSADTAIDGIGRMIQGVDVAKIQDGVDYSLPMSFPRWLEDELQRSGKMAQFMENYRQAAAMQFDSPYKTDLPFSPVTEDPLREWSRSTRERVLSNTHAAADRNPTANLAVRLTSNFVIGSGFRLTTKCAEVDTLLNEFIESADNRIRQYERQIIKGVLTDGELMLRLFISDDGKTTAVPMRPWECQSINTELGFFRRIEHFRFQFQKTEGDDPGGENDTETADVPADEVLFIAFNNQAYELRGKPQLYVILSWLKAHKDWLENRARLNYWRSVIIWLVRSTGYSAQAQAALAARWARPPTPGSVSVESDKVSVEALHNPIDAGGAAEDGRQMKLMVGNGVGLPEYMLGDGSNANLASSTSQELPALVLFVEYQNILINELWKPLFRRVIQNAIDAGKLPDWCDECDVDGDPVYEKLADESMEYADTPMPMDTMPADGTQGIGNTEAQDMPISAPMPRKVKKIEAIKAFDVNYQSLRQYDVSSVAQAHSVAIAGGFSTPQTAAEAMGNDWAVIKKQLEAEKQEGRDEMLQGLKPTPPGMLGKPAGNANTKDTRPVDNVGMEMPPVAIAGQELDT